MKLTKAILCVTLAFAGFTSAPGAERPTEKLYVEGSFKVQNNVYVPAVRAYHRIDLRMETVHGRFFYFSHNVDPDKQKEFTIGSTYKIRIDVSDMHLIKDKLHLEMYSHPKIRIGYLIGGFVEFIGKVSANKAIDSDKK